MHWVLDPQLVPMALFWEVVGTSVIGAGPWVYLLSELSCFSLCFGATMRWTAQLFPALSAMIDP